MKALLSRLIPVFLVLLSIKAAAITRYVNLNNPNPSPPYTSWAAAATRIQDAVDAASAGDQILVTNGVYQTGGRVVYGSLTNRLAVTKPVTVRSVNGSEATHIVGYQVPGTIYGPSAVRCAYLTNGAALIGFTLTNGSTWDISGEPPITWAGGGGVYCESSSAIVSNCVIVRNAAGQGGGVYGGTIINCILQENQAHWYGGGASDSTLSNCALTRNLARFEGGGAMVATLNNCTLTANTPSGADTCTLNNCILFYNTPVNYASSWWGSTLNFCCTTPLPGDGTGNISAEPQLASASHLSAGSPCRGAGSAASVTGVDIDGDAWTNPPPIGCDEFKAAVTPGTLTVALQTSLTNVAVGFPVIFAASIDGRCIASRWDFADGTIVSNRPVAMTHAWAAAGDYPVILTAYDGSSPAGISATSVVHVVAEVHYVSLTSPNPVAPYSSWATAATNIQDAADVASLPGALVLVSNGVYQIGGRAVYGTMTNRVVVSKPARVQSVNGPGVTVIQGYQLPGTTNGDGAIRCVYLTNEAVLNGFTLTGGATRADGDGETEQGAGGVWCESVSAVVSNCVLVGNAAAYVGGGARGGTLINCTLESNLATYGGGAYAGTLNGCLLTNNTAGDQGGGAHAATLNGCTLLANSAANAGGGVSSSALNSCTLTGNSANSGGGSQDSTLNDCTLTGNSASASGGGANGGTLNNCRLLANWAVDSGGGANSVTLKNCHFSGNAATNYGGGVNGCTVQNSLLIGNSAGLSGGGASGGTLNNGTLTGNSASSGGGANGVTLNNCILFYNSAGRDENHTASSLSYCCTTPLPTSGMGNITTEPQLIDSSHLSAGSPCRAAGSFAYAVGTDIDGETWLNPPSIGCDEYYAGPVTGALSVTIQAAYTNVAAGFAVDFAGLIDGHATASRWDFSDGSGLVSNQLYTAHSWVSAGDYPVVLRAFNDSNPGGVSTTVIVHVVTQPIHYVALGSVSPVPPYNSWATAATNIQHAVDAATLPGALVLVTNGNYQTGGQVMFGALTNRVVINKPVTVRSVNGPTLTVIQGTPTNGDSAVRCVYLGSGATLSGLTLTRGATRTDGDGDREQSGGAVWCESTSAVISNCVLTANTAQNVGGAVSGGSLFNCTLSTNSAGSGGAVYLAELEDCSLTGNRAGDSGGAAYATSLIWCSLTANTAANTGGGAYASALINCTLSGNSATNYGGGVNGGILNGCVLSGNSSGGYGGGAEGATLNHCNVTANSALYGGGANSCTLNNCILQFNSAPQHANYAGGTLNYCCTTPLPTAGTGNLAADPQLAGLAHLSTGSPCRGAGSAAYSSGVDIDGEAWANPPSIGCDEYRVGALTGPLSVGIQATQTNFATGFVASFTAQLGGRVSDSRWEFGDGTIVSNQPYASHAWVAAGDYPVVLRAYNESNPGGITATVIVHVVTQPIHYVRASGSTPVSPFTSWATAANNIQSAVDAASVSGALVLVSNGTYQTGGRVVIEATNRVVVTKPLVVRSVNGPTVTTINGGGVMRCAYVADGAVLSGFTLANGVVGQFEMVDASERNGGGARCTSLSVLLTNCVVTGCSGSGGGGGVISGTLYNCTFSGNSVSYGGGGVSSAILNNCMFTSNSAFGGGAASGSTLNDCTLIGNGAWYGGGVEWCTLNRCLLTANSGGNGGGAYNATLNFCLLTNNTAQYWGGGALNGTLDNCTLIGNYANSGGAALDATLRNCLLYANSAGHGGGTVAGTLYNCTITGNSAGSGGGADGSTLNNCIVYYNNAPVDSNYTASCTLNFSCVSPPPASGTGNLAADPQLASLTRISAASPCRGAGSAVYVTGTDIDGEPWLNPPSIGCDEYYSGGLTGLITVACQANYTNVATGIPVRLTSKIDGLVTASRWEFGDGTIASNQPAVTHSWSAAGNYVVVLRAYNETYPAGVTTTLTVHVLVNPVHYVALNNPSPAPPYLSWSTAANNIQDAVDAAYTGGIVVVSDGVYSSGSRVVSGSTNRVALTRPMTLQSYGGPAVTIINGAQAMRGVYLAEGTTLLGFTVTNGTTSGDGGGVFCELPSLIVSNCVLTGNSAASGSGGGVYGGTIKNCILRGNNGANGAGAATATLYECELLNNSGANGGGAYASTLNRCRLSGNYAYSPNTGGGGGGAYGSTLNNCLIISNAAPIWGGGAYGSTLNNCTVVGNYGGQRGAGIFEGTANNSILYDNYKFGGVIENFSALYWWQVTLNYCCTTPMPDSGGANFTNAPLFLNLSTGNFRLQNNSPCINAGNNGYVAGSTDLDGNRRIIDGAVDIGAYEFVPPDLAAFIQWLQSYGLPVDGSADYTDTDADSMSNYGEWRSDTIPTNTLSVLRMVSATNSATGANVTWQSVATRSYWLERATNLGVASPFETVATNVPGAAGAKIYTDTTATNGGPYFYRVGVQ